VAREFEGIKDADSVLLFGSWAARYLGEPGRAPDDVDVLVIGSPDRDAVDDAAERVERTIGIPVQATVCSRSQWTSERDGFIREVRSRPLVVVLAHDTMVDALSLTGMLHGVGAMTSTRGDLDTPRRRTDCGTGAPGDRRRSLAPTGVDLGSELLRSRRP
jgi:hypothetical protein